MISYIKNFLIVHMHQFIIYVKYELMQCYKALRKTQKKLSSALLSKEHTPESGHTV